MAGRIMMPCMKGRESGCASDHEPIQFLSPIGGYVEMMRSPKRQGRPCRLGDIPREHARRKGKGFNARYLGENVSPPLARIPRCAASPLQSAAEPRVPH